MLDAAYNARIDIMAFEPEAILLFNCVSRRFFLREDTSQELQPFQTIAANAGLYVHGEIGRDNNGNVFLLNMSLVSASFREGPQDGNFSSTFSLAPCTKELSDTMKLVNCLANFVEVTSAESEIANEQLAHLASIDRLTGLYNRGEIESILRKTLLGNRAGDGPLSAVMVDLDDFKRVNDTFGHAIGDAALRGCAGMIREKIRRSDAAGRWGGEEFLIILPGTSLESAKIVAENIRAALEARKTLPDETAVTGSFGVAKFPDDGSVMTFYKQIDRALYRAKEKGKNCVCVAGEEPEEDA